MYIVWTLTFYNPKRDLLAVLQRVNLNLGHMRTKKNVVYSGLQGSLKNSITEGNKSKNRKERKGVKLRTRLKVA